MELPGVTALLDKCLGVKPPEKAAIVYGSDRKRVRLILEQGVADRGLKFKSIPIENRDGSWTRDALEILEDPEYPVIIFTSVRSIWHHPARKRAKYDLGKRIVAVICEDNGFSKGYSQAAPDDMEKIGAPLSKLLTTGAKVRIVSPAGTDVEAIVEIPFFETGMYRNPATGGNWPSGEIGFGPREGSVNGVVVYDVKFKHLGALAKRPAKVKIVEDRCVEFSGEGGEELEDMFYSRDRALMYVGEVAMGLNPCFEHDANVVIIVDPDPRTIVEEKALGTAHFGHGGNLSFGKRIGDHADGVIAKPTIIIDDVTVMKDGQLSPIERL